MDDTIMQRFKNPPWDNANLEPVFEHVPCQLQNTKNRESTHSWLIRVWFLHPWAATPSVHQAKSTKAHGKLSLNEGLCKPKDGQLQCSALASRRSSSTSKQRAQPQQRSRQGEQLQLNKEKHQQRSRPEEQPQLNNYIRDHSCAEGAVVGLAADTHIFFWLTCAVAQSKRVLAWINQPPNWHLSNLYLRFFTLAFVHACTQHDSHRHCWHNLSQIVQFIL